MHRAAKLLFQNVQANQLGITIPKAGKHDCTILRGSVIGTTTELMDVACKVAIISGGTTGIGYATAYSLLEHGVQHVAISGRDKERGSNAENTLRQKFGKNSATYIQGCVQDEHHFKDLFETTMDQFKHVDILYNNAGVMIDKDWDEEIDINIKGVLNGCYTALKYMSRECGGEGGVIINQSSIAGIDPLPGAPVYCASKHAVVGLSTSFGDPFHYNRTGIRVLALCPGVTATKMITNMESSQYNKLWGKEAKRFIKQYTTQSPFKVSRAVMHMVRFAPTGTVWMIDRSQLFYLDMPDYCKYSELQVIYL